MTYRFTRSLAANVRAKPKHPARKVDSKGKGLPYFTATTLALKLEKKFNVVEKKKTDNLAQIIFLVAAIFEAPALLPDSAPPDDVPSRLA